MTPYSKLAPFVLSSLFLAACGGGGGSSTTTMPTPVVMTTPPTPPTTSSSEPVLIADIEFAQAATEAGDIPLLLDIYQPQESCDENRPTVLFVHGGAFVSGNKSSNDIIALAEATNDRDMNFVSIQYRLAGDEPVLTGRFQELAVEFLPIVPVLQRPLVTAAVAATEDTVTALTWMEENADEFCLDTSSLAYWGSSAGSITVLQVAYGLNQFNAQRP